MAMLNYDEYNNSNSYWIQEEPYTNWPTSTGTNQINFVYPSLICPHCNAWITQYQWYQFCPYCGKPLYPQSDKKTKIIKRLDAILKEVKDIKKELLKY